MFCFGGRARMAEGWQPGSHVVAIVHYSHPSPLVLGSFNPCDMGVGGSVLSTPLPSSEWKKVNCGKYRTCSFVCVFSLRPRGTGAQSARQSIDLTFRRWLAGGRHPATLHNPPPPPMFPKQCPPRLSSRQIFGKGRHCRLQRWNCLSVRTFKPHLPQTPEPITTPFLSMDFIFKTSNLGLDNDVSSNHFWGCHTWINNVNSKPSSHVRAFLDG